MEKKHFEIGKISTIKYSQLCAMANAGSEIVAQPINFVSVFVK